MIIFSALELAKNFPFWCHSRFGFVSNTLSTRFEPRVQLKRELWKFPRRVRISKMADRTFTAIRLCKLYRMRETYVSALLCVSLCVYSIHFYTLVEQRPQSVNWPTDSSKRSLFRKLFDIGIFVKWNYFWLFICFHHYSIFFMEFSFFCWLFIHFFSSNFFLAYRCTNSIMHIHVAWQACYHKKLFTSPDLTTQPSMIVTCARMMLISYITTICLLCAHGQLTKE